MCSKERDGRGLRGHYDEEFPMAVKPKKREKAGARIAKFEILTKAQGSKRGGLEGGQEDTE